jgi:Rho GTPase-activating protein 1
VRAFDGVECSRLITSDGIASTLTGLALHLPIQDLLIPPSAYVTDRHRSKFIDVPYTTGRRAFGVKEPLPIASNGLRRLPRVLREATSFVVLDPLIKTEGLFRISSRAVMVDILTEAYDRAQQFVVWREGDVTLSHGHMKEGTGIVFVDELDQTDGYELHAATGLIKRWYRELRDPIFPQTCYASLEKFYGTSYSGIEIPLKVPQLLEFLCVNGEWSPINQTSRNILTMHLLPLLSRLTEFEEWNQMGAYNLAVCFAQCLIRGPDPIEDLKMSSLIRRILMALIVHWKADLAPRFGMDLSKFEESLRMPEAVEDYEDPVQEPQGPRSSLEAQVSGITLVDNENGSDSDVDDRPPLPPRPLPSGDTATPGSTPVRRKPAPPVQTLPRYSMIISENPGTLEHIDSYNTVPLGDIEPLGSLPGASDGPELPKYEPSSAVITPPISNLPSENPKNLPDSLDSSIREDPAPRSVKPEATPSRFPRSLSDVPEPPEHDMNLQTPTSPILSLARKPLSNTKPKS